MALAAVMAHTVILPLVDVVAAAELAEARGAPWVVMEPRPTVTAVTIRGTSKKGYSLTWHKYI